MYKKIISLILIAFVLLSLAGCGAGEKFVYVAAREHESYSAFGEKGSATLENTEGLVKAAENEYLELYYDKETFVLTVFDKRSGQRFTSSPDGQQPDSTNTSLAALNLIYSNSQGKTGSIDSFTKSVKLGQVETEKTKGGIIFNYSIGDASDGLEVTPTKISNERFEKLLEKADSSQKKTLERRYSYIKDYDVWSRRKIANPRAAEELVTVFKELGYDAEELAKDNKENGVSDRVEEKLSFSLPLSVVLEGDSLRVSIDLSKVKYPSNNKLIQIELLPLFSAADASQRGSFLLPDGSGAVMPFAAVESGAESYVAAINGADTAMRKMGDSAKSQDAVLPVFGMDRLNSGFIGIVEQGEALGDILAYNSGATDAYNKIYSRVNFLKSESVALGSSAASDNFNYYNIQKQSYQGEYAVRYIFLDANNCSYNGMAAAYRSYLLSSGRITDRKASEKVPFLLESVGGILSDRSFLGFQYKGITALTKYSDNTEMAKKLEENGVENINIRLTAFMGDGRQNLLAGKQEAISALGGAKGLKALAASAKESGFKVFPDYEYLTFSANSSVLTKNKYALKSMDHKAVKLEITDPVTLKKNSQISDNAYYITAVSHLKEVDRSVRSQLEKYGFKQMSLADMAHGIGSDFTSNESYDRQSAQNYASELIEGLSKDYEMLLCAPNAASIGNANLVCDAPLWSSGYKFANGVPFYQMVFHGLVDYTGEAINLSSDTRKEFLRCIEYGAALKYTLIYRNRSVIKNSDYTELYSAGFEDSLKQAAENYKHSNALWEKTAEAAITEHTELYDGVYQTCYSNGVYTVVNYNDSEYLSEYGAVGAKNYIIGQR